MRRLLLAMLFAVLGLGVVQAVPYNRWHDNPPALAEPSWDPPRTWTLAARACFGCHTNEDFSGLDGLRVGKIIESCVSLDRIYQARREI